MFQHLKINIFFILLILITVSFTKHDEYYSLTNIQYKENEKTLQITMRVFADDLENALKLYYTRDFELNTQREFKDVTVYIEKYLKTKFNLYIGSKILNYSFLGKEHENDMVYLFIEIKNVAPFKTLQIRNAVLTEVYPTQENIVKVKAFGSYKSLILNKNMEIGTITF